MGTQKSVSAFFLENAKSDLFRKSLSNSLSSTFDTLKTRKSG